MVTCLIEAGQANVDPSQIVQHVALQSGMTQVSCYYKRRAELIKCRRESALPLMQQAQIAQRVGFEPPVAHLPGRRERRLPTGQRFIQVALVEVQPGKIAE